MHVTVGRCVCCKCTAVNVIFVIYSFILVLSIWLWWNTLGITYVGGFVAKLMFDLWWKRYTLSIDVDNLVLDNNRLGRRLSWQSVMQYMLWRLLVLQFVTRSNVQRSDESVAPMFAITAVRIRWLVDTISVYIKSSGNDGQSSVITAGRDINWCVFLLATLSSLFGKNRQQSHRR